jgi:hypothetical protein
MRQGTTYHVDGRPGVADLERFLGAGQYLGHVAAHGSRRAVGARWIEGDDLTAQPSQQRGQLVLGHGVQGGAVGVREQQRRRS